MGYVYKDYDNNVDSVIAIANFLGIPAEIVAFYASKIRPRGVENIINKRIFNPLPLFASLLMTSLQTWRNSSSWLRKIWEFYSTYTSWLIIPALLAGILGAKYFPFVFTVADQIMSPVLNWLLEYIAPLAIFLILSPSVAKILKIRKENKLAGFVILWFSVTRILAAIWAACFVSLILGLPLVPDLYGGDTWTAFTEVGGQLKHMLLTERFFIAMYLSIAIGIVSYFIPPLYRLLQKGIDGVEAVGKHIGAWVPLLVFLIGAFIYGLPAKISSKISSETLHKLDTVTIVGIKFNLTEEFGLVGVYVIEATMIGVGCFIWQIIQVLIVRKLVPGFTVKGFFHDYWIKVYPLAWSTASEAVSMPLNIFTIKRAYPRIQASVRKLVVGLGAYLNVNGTAMDIMIITAVVSSALGYPVSLLGLLISVPFIAIIGYGIPGIPGEAIIFLPLMLTIVNLPPELVTTFAAIFVAVQLGLPDSFRTGANVTDNGIYAVWINNIFEKRFDY